MPAPIKETYCIRHQRFLSVSEFYRSLNPMHDSGYLPYCKKCIEHILKSHLQKYRTLEASVYYTCAEMGIPFVQKAYEAYAQQNKKLKGGANFGHYINALLVRPTKAQLEAWTDFGGTDRDLNDIEDRAPSEKAIDLQEAELQLAWGKQYDSDQLAYLEYRFGLYTKDRILGEYEESVYRNLCRAELDIYEENDPESAMKRQAQCAKILKLDEFQNQQNRSVAERMLEHDIAVMEQNEPAEYYKDKSLYKDFRGIHAGWILELLRPVKNLIVGSKEYPVEIEEMEAFEDTVERVEEDEGTVQFSVPQGDRTKV